MQLKTNNPNLSRDIRYYLRQKFPLEIECTPKVEAKTNAPVELDIKLPIGLTDDLFPLDLAIEVYDMTLSPNATMNNLPVETGKSIIPNKEDIATFRFIKTIESKSEYDALPTVGNRKTFTTYWLTNKIDNESTIYVVNKYFNVARDSFINTQYGFTDVMFDPAIIECGFGKTVSIRFTMDNEDNNYKSRPITVELNGMTDIEGNSVLTISPNSRTITLSGLITTKETENLSFKIDADGYGIGMAYGKRLFYEFEGMFDRKLLGTTAGERVDYDFNIPMYTEGMSVRVTLDGLKPADDEARLELVQGEENVYLYTPSASGMNKIKLQTANAGERTCAIILEADEYYYRPRKEQIDQKSLIALSGNIKLDFSFDHSMGMKSGDKITISIYANDETTISSGYEAIFESYTGSTRPYQCLILVNGLNITDALPTTSITITCKCKSSYNDYNYSATVTIDELRNAIETSESITITEV